MTLSITEGGKEGRSKAITSCTCLEGRFQECSKKGVGLATGVETLGVDLRSGTKQLGTKEKARRKTYDVRFSLMRKNRVFQKNYRRTGVRKLLRTGWVGEDKPLASLRTERVKLRRQMAAVAGRKESVSLSFSWK